MVFYATLVMSFGSTRVEHNARLEGALSRFSAAGVTLEKCEFCRSFIWLLGDVIDQQGIHPYTEMISAILSLKSFSNVTELCRFFSKANQMGKSILKLASLSQAL